MAESSMPGKDYTDLTLGSFGAAYTAPANGWFYFCSGMPNNNSLVVMAINATDATDETTARSTCDYLTTWKNFSAHWSADGAIIPVKEGDVMNLYYSNIGTVINFRFIYAAGASDNDSGAISDDERESLTVQGWDSI